MSGGSSSSKNQTSNTDNRMVLDGGAIGMSGFRNWANAGAVSLNESSGNTINVVDPGAVSGALDLATEAVQDSLSVVKDSFLESISLVKSLASDFMQSTADQGSGLVQFQEAQGAQLAAAYTDSKGTKDVLVIGALLIGGVAIAFILKK